MSARNKILAMALVDRLIVAGSPISAVSDTLFGITDVDIPEDIDASLGVIMAEFEPIDPLRPYIVEYLRELYQSSMIRTHWPIFCVRST